MKTLTFLLAWLLVVVSASAADAVLQLQLGEPTHIQTPASSATAGSEWVQFPVRVTNASAQPVWLDGHSLASPFYGLSTRPEPTAAWADYGVGFCGTGAGRHQLAPGAVTTFSVAVPTRYAGQQLRVELSVYRSDHDAAPTAVSSEPATIR